MKKQDGYVSAIYFWLHLAFVFIPLCFLFNDSFEWCGAADRGLFNSIYDFC